MHVGRNVPFRREAPWEGLRRSRERLEKDLGFWGVRWKALGAPWDSSGTAWKFWEGLLGLGYIKVYHCFLIL